VARWSTRALAGSEAACSGPGEHRSAQRARPVGRSLRGFGSRISRRAGVVGDLIALGWAILSLGPVVAALAGKCEQNLRGTFMMGSVVDQR